MAGAQDAAVSGGKPVPADDLEKAVAEVQRLDRLLAEKDREIAALAQRIKTELQRREQQAARAFGEFLQDWGVRIKVTPDGVHLIAVEG